MSAFRLAPESTGTGVHLPQETLSFSLSDSGILTGGLRFSFLLKCGTGSPINAPFAPNGADQISLSQFAGAAAVISRLWIQSDATGEILYSENDFQRTTSVLTGVGYSAAGMTLGSKSCRELTTYSPWVAQNLVRTCNADADRRQITISLHDVVDMLRQDLPLNLLQLRIYIQLAPAAAVFYSAVDPATAAATYEITSPFLEGYILRGQDPKSASISYTRLETLTQVVSSQNATINLSASNSAACIGCVVSFVPTASMNNLVADQSVLATPTGGLNSVSYRIGVQSVLAYDIIPYTQNGAQNWVEAIDYALQLFMGLQGAKTTITPDRVAPNTLLQRPNYFLLGVPFSSPTDLRRQQFSLQLTTGIVSTNPFLCYVTFISRSTLQLGVPPAGGARK
jgi:hypothetical protein